MNSNLVDILMVYSTTLFKSRKWKEIQIEKKLKFLLLFR